VCNTFNGGHVFGQPLTSPPGIDLRLEGVVLRVNGEVRASATAVEVLGDPLNAVVFIANKLAELGLSLKAGMVLMTGSIVPSVVVSPGDEVQVDFTRLGQVRVRFVA
jgi:2-oxopent-4-enoate/cis-2-oxohex-4-enoate hydratase